MDRMSSRITDRKWPKQNVLEAAQSGHQGLPLFDPFIGYTSWGEGNNKSTTELGPNMRNFFLYFSISKSICSFIYVVVKSILLADPCVHICNW
jgi:hypothetical protein